MTKPASYIGVQKRFASCSAAVQGFFSEFAALLDQGFSYHVIIAYVYLCTEQAHNRALYAAVVKLHQADASMAASILNRQHLTRDGFTELYARVFGCELPQDTQGLLAKADEIRDRIMHGKPVTDAEVRAAICDILDYANAFNAHVKEVAKFEPFGDLRGFKGRGQAHNKATTRWLLKGLGFSVS